MFTYTSMCVSLSLSRRLCVRWKVAVTSYSNDIDTSLQLRPAMWLSSWVFPVFLVLPEGHNATSVNTVSTIPLFGRQDLTDLRFRSTEQCASICGMAVWYEGTTWHEMARLKEWLPVSTLVHWWRELRLKHGQSWNMLRYDKYARPCKALQGLQIRFARPSSIPQTPGVFPERRGRWFISWPALEILQT